MLSQCAATWLHCCCLQMAEYIRNERNVLDKLHHPGVTQLHFTFQVGASTVSAVTVTAELCGPSCKTAVKGQRRGSTAERLHCCVMCSRVAQPQAVNCTVSGRDSFRQGRQTTLAAAHNSSMIYSAAAPFTRRILVCVCSCRMAVVPNEAAGMQSHPTQAAHYHHALLLLCNIRWL
jgi:hypothetical protein